MAASLLAMATAAVIACAALGAVRSAAQVVAIDMYATRTSTQLASRIDPGNYRLHLRLAQDGRRQQRCDHARAARSLFPGSGEARDLSRGCGDR